MNAIPPSARAFILLQKFLPKHLLTAAIHSLARITTVPVKNWFISRFVAAFAVDIDEVAAPVPGGYASFNEFFTRELAPGARPIAPDGDALISPVDGTVSAVGKIEGNTLIQAKGITYTLFDLLASDLSAADEFIDGSFATIYLAPYNYHRVHCPIDAELMSALYIPGQLYSVNEATVSGLPGLFTGNERLVCRFNTSVGHFVLIFVGALNVGSISTPWTGEIRPQKSGVVQLQDLSKSTASRNLAKGDLLGWFNMGSTVIMLLPNGGCDWRDDLVPGSQLRMGERIASIAGQSK